MAAITVTAAQVAAVYPDTARIRNYTCAATITAGQTVYRVATTGRADLCDANDAGKEQFRGIALGGGGVGQAISVLEEGEVFGFDLSGINYDALVYQGDTAGALDTAASGTKTIQVGRVVAINDAGTLTKALYVRADMIRNW